jgi:hypothetical protein
MTITFNPADDFPNVIDRIETVYLHSLTGGEPIEVDGALKRGHAARQHPDSGGGLANSDARWHLPVSVLEDSPQIGDCIVDGESTAWTIVEVHHEGSGRWLCICRNLALVLGLSEVIDIQRAVWTKDAAGAARATWHPWMSALPAQIHPLTARVVNDEGRTHLLATHHVLLAQPVHVDQDCRVVGPGGAVYRILGVQFTDQLVAPHILDVLQETHP